MKEFFTLNEEIFYSIVSLTILVILAFITRKAIKRIGKLNDYNHARTKLILRYTNISIFFLLVIVISFIWSIDFRQLGVFFSSVFAVIGVALFAQWSIISNVTSGIILFFSFPFKIGDKIKIQDKDFPLEAVIEDIKAFNVNLRTLDGELVTYPNSLFLQKPVMVLKDEINDDGSGSV
ncbi:mechanosensitive ion channel domain-containing protein [Abyssalbus ytuae]|uniref:Mechanosensitive ion channel family protein n=1 Tax=Abyssalbus ytuae TaxID=2926907 RepID=A0A9E6ZSX0_9FLAO|nr:mechanosensitive ion channel domain-containing protein [Abyssalbus ytuae]UOB17248.1 mechanosensitive ion channel family protein [Abyssalbus ytuae]